MSWLKRRRREDPESAPSEPAARPECPHLVLVPRWERVADMGKTDLATSFRCDACQREFSPDEASELRATEGERLRQLVG
jgi:hypothetical protein